jgi:hypothetical protein
MQILDIAIGVLFICVGVLGVVAPSRVLALGYSLATPSGLFAMGVVRVAIGAAIYHAAAYSHTPLPLRIFGAFVILGGIAMPILGVKRACIFLNWCASFNPLFLRAWALAVALVGAFLIYAVREME